MNINIVYFAFLLKNKWQPIILEQLNSLKNINLYNIASKIYMTVISDDIEIIELREILKDFPKIILIHEFKDNVYEYPGLKLVHDISTNDPNTIILYFHSKGMISNTAHIRKLLFDSTINNYQKYVNEFKNNTNLDVAGSIPHKNGFIFFNFFWIRSSYVNQYVSKPMISSDRYIWEIWIGNDFSKKKDVITFSPYIKYDGVTTHKEVWDIYEQIKKQLETQDIEPIKIEKQLNDETQDIEPFYNALNDYIIKNANPNLVLVNISQNDLICNNYKSVINANNIVAIKEKDDQTFKEFLFYKLNNDKIQLINIDYDGKEEDIIEDVLHFSWNNDVKVLINFNIMNWKDKNINRFNYLFKFFKCYNKDEIINPIEHLKMNNNELIFIEKNKNMVNDLYKKNMTCMIISYNQPTYIKMMVKQMEKYTNDIVIVDNNSTYEPLLEYYKNEYKYSLLKMNKNYGHTVYQNELIKNVIGPIYILTDPDLEFNKNLPDNFIENLIDILINFSAEKVGFALLHNAPDIRDVIVFNRSITNWEDQFWNFRIYYKNYELYKANIDTTFCLVNTNNKKNHLYGPRYRIAGDYLCKHLPWHTNYRDIIPDEEYNYYLKNNKSSNYFK